MHRLTGGRLIELGAPASTSHIAEMMPVRCNVA
jgi:hypothetical protein